VAEPLERWLAVADNRGEWERLRRALALEQGFVLLIVDVPDVGTEARVVELLAREQPVVVLDAQQGGEHTPVRELLRRRGKRVVIRSVEASRSDIEALEHCLVQLNTRRDQIVEHEHVLVIVLRRDAVARIIDVAPDLYSVHRARFRFARLVQPRPAPAWLLSDQEFAAVLDDDGRPFDVRLADYSLLFDADEPFMSSLAERFFVFARGPAEDRIAARIFARHEGVRCLAWPQTRDLAHALETPALDSIDILRDSLRLEQAAGIRALTTMCANALTWMHLQRSEVVEARAAHDIATVHVGTLTDRFRHQLLALELDAAEGLAALNPLIHQGDFIVDPSWMAAALLTLAACEFELQRQIDPLGNLHAALDIGMESLRFNKWRLDARLRAMPPGLVEAVVSESERVEAIAWLESRQRSTDLDWDETWTKYLMIERSIGDAEHVAKLVDLGHEWLGAQSRIYEVWRPLVEIHVERRDATMLEPLVRMPLTTHAEQHFGPRLAAGLHIVADLVDRGIVELSGDEREQLRARAAARDRLPLALRLGWWAIELALDAKG
jgi:hypothetical protein